MVKRRKKQLKILGINEFFNLRCLEPNVGQIVGIPKNPRYHKAKNATS